MVHANAVIHGDRAQLLAMDPVEHPVALQLGGSDPSLLAHAARIGAGYGFDEINLNCGCPSDRVQAGRFGACLMREPALVAECIAAMADALPDGVPVSVKCRLGVDDDDDFDRFIGFIDTVAAAGAAISWCMRAMRG
jgi:tRNA-dihydrouridine synthase